MVVAAKETAKSKQKIALISDFLIGLGTENPNIQFTNYSLKFSKISFKLFFQVRIVNFKV